MTNFGWLKAQDKMPVRKHTCSFGYHTCVVELSDFSYFFMVAELKAPVELW